MLFLMFKQGYLSEYNYNFSKSFFSTIKIICFNYYCKVCRWYIYGYNIIYIRMYVHDLNKIHLEYFYSQKYYIDILMLKDASNREDYESIFIYKFSYILDI